MTTNFTIKNFDIREKIKKTLFFLFIPPIVTPGVTVRKFTRLFIFVPNYGIKWFRKLEI